MKKSKILITSLFLVLFALVLSVFGVNLKATTNTSDALSIKGVSVRTTGGSELIGIRFVGEVDGYTPAGTIEAYGVSIAFGEVEAADITIGGTVNDRSVLSAQVSETNDNEYYINLINIPENMYGQKVTARSYIVEDGNVIYSTTAATKSLGQATLDVKAAGGLGENIDTVINKLSTGYKNMFLDSQNNVFVNNPIYETNPAKLEEEFVADWNTKFATSWTEVTATAICNSAAKGYTANTDTDPSVGNLFKFFRDTENGYGAKWSWLLEYIASLNGVWPTRQANAILSYNLETNTNNNTYGLYKDQHLAGSIANFFNQESLDPGYAPVMFGTPSKYSTLNDFNDVIFASDATLVAVNSTINLPEANLDAGYQLNYYTCNETQYTSEYTVASENAIFVPNITPIEYTITYFNGEEELVELGSTYTVEDEVVLADSGIEGFVNWYENSNLSGDPVTTIEKGSTGDKVYYAYVVEGTVVSITYDYMDSMTKEEIWTEFRADVATYSKSSHATDFLTYSDGNSYSKDYVPLKAAIDNSPAEFTAKWAWLFNSIADAHANASTYYSSDIKLMATGTYTTYGIYTFCQEMKGFYKGIQATQYAPSASVTVVMYNWATDASNEYAEVYAASKTANKTENLISGNELATPTREGYSFGGWYTTSAYTEGTKVDVVPSVDCTLYAKWDNLYTVTLNANGGYFGYETLADVEADFIADVNEVLGTEFASAVDYHASDYKANVWKATQTEFRAKWLWLMEYIKDTCSAQSVDTSYAQDIIDGGTVSAYALQNIVLIFLNTDGATAKLSVEEGGYGLTIPSTYTCCNFSSQNDGFWSNYVQSTSVKVSSTDLLPTNLYKAGYTFDGWYTTSTFDEGTKVTSVSSDTTVYAKWVEAAN